jgi:hypothetical protein
VRFFSFAAEAQTITPPDVVKLPSINLGGSSFFDGLGRVDPGWVFLDYPRWDDLTSIRNSKGRDSPLFVNPRIGVFSNLFDIVRVWPISVSGGAPATEVLLPVVDFQPHFDAPGLVLHNNGLNIGDLAFGTLYQSKPITLGSRPVFSWRIDLAFIAPNGGFHSRRDINLDRRRVDRRALAWR